MYTCPSCQSTDHQVKNGRTAAGSQRYWCRCCGRKYTPEPKAQGYPPEMRRQALRMYVDGGNLRRIGRTLGVVHQTVANWVTAASDACQTPRPFPTGSRRPNSMSSIRSSRTKNWAYVVTEVDRATRCFNQGNVPSHRSLRPTFSIAPASALLLNCCRCSL